jgi:hypothetical protein
MLQKLHFRPKDGSNGRRGSREKNGLLSVASEWSLLLDSMNSGPHSTRDASDRAARIEAKMSELRYPNENREYRDARDAFVVRKNKIRRYTASFMSPYS